MNERNFLAELERYSQLLAAEAEGWREVDRSVCEWLKTGEHIQVEIHKTLKSIARQNREVRDRIRELHAESADGDNWWLKGETPPWEN